MPRRPSSSLKSGDMVMIRSPREIMQTLDANGTLDGLPFMPEMLEFCGKRFRVLNRVVQSTIDAAFISCPVDSFVREFRNNDVIILRGVRCCGAQHDSCQRGCSIFWKDAWLQKVNADDAGSVPTPDHSTANDLLPILQTKIEPDRYFCQSSEFLKATLPLSMTQRFKKCLSAVAARNLSVWGMMKRILIWTWWKTHNRLIGQHAWGEAEKTPTLALGLQPGDMVEIKSLEQIRTTLNRDGRNRGLHFSADQRPFCGGKYRVRSRADNFIAEGTGEMKHFRNTVILEEVLCDSATFAFGGCYRADLLYWREIWLKKIEPPAIVDLSNTNAVPCRGS